MALLTMFTLLHLSVAAGDVACATPSAESVGSAAQGMTHAEHGVSAAAAESGAGTIDVAPHPCSAATHPPCCEAMVDCVTFGALAASSVDVVSMPDPVARIGAALVKAPPSFVPVPEPPPPKA